MPARQGAGDRESESGASLGTRRRGAPEAVEHPLEMLLRDADAGVSYRDECVAVLALDFYRDGAVRLRVLQRIFDQVREDALDLIRCLP